MKNQHEIEMHGNHSLGQALNQALKQKGRRW